MELERMDWENVKRNAEDLMRQAQLQEMSARYMYDRALEELEDYPNEDNKDSKDND